MTYPWRICSSAILWLAAMPAVAATVTGQVELTGAGGAKLKSAEGVVVWLEPVQGPAPLPPGKLHVVNQRGKRFIPHVSVVPVGTTIDLPNNDPIFHNAFSNFAGQPFDTGLYPPGSTHRIRFQRDGVVRVFCNIHSTMSAVIVVVNSPWHATSDKSGAVRIDGVPPGEYTMRVWHERAAEGTLGGLEKRVTVQGASSALPAVSISEAGYVQTPHPDKHGRAYTAPPATGPGMYGSRKK